MIAVRPNDVGEVVSVRYVAKALMPGEVEVAVIPPEPIVWQYEDAVMILQDGKIAYRIDQLPEPEPEEPHIPTAEEITALRKAAYTTRVDPITCEIERLKEMGGTEDEIEAARQRRAEEVAAIKSEYPYPEEEK